MKKIAIFFSIVARLLFQSETVHALGADQAAAKILFERLTGTKVSKDDARLNEMEQLLKQGRPLEAAAIATEDSNFYRVTVKLMALQMSTKEETVKIKLNDFAAGIIGVTRDGRDARELLTGNFYYRAVDVAGVRQTNNDIFLTNNHYADLDDAKTNLKNSLVRVEGQKIMTNASTAVNNPDPAGVLTSRAFMEAHAVAGTNRRLVEYAFREFMCVPLSEFADSKASDARIGRDIDRFPGGDNNKYETSCKSCHTVMDGFRGAFAKYDFKGQGIINSDVNATTGGNFAAEVDANKVMLKFNKNPTVFPAGYTTTGNTFVNNAVRPENMERFGWTGDYQAGQGVKDFGRVLSGSKRFSQCMAKRVYEAVCNKSIDPIANKALLEDWGRQFEGMNYNLKRLFEMVSVQKQCL